MGQPPGSGKFGGATIRTGGALVAGLCAFIVCLGGAPGALGKPKQLRCRNGTIQAKVGGKAACVPRTLALPAPSNTNPIVAQVQGALALTELSFTTRGGKHVRSFSQQFGRAWTTARSRLQRAVAGIIVMAQQSARKPTASVAAAGHDCAVADVVDNYGSDPGGNIVKSSSSASVGGVNVTMGLGASGAQIGLSATVNGDTFTMKYDSGEASCLAYNLPPCPQADGSLDAYGIKGKTGFSMTVTRAGKVLSREAYAKTITVETKGQVADDAKLDYVDVKYGETTNFVKDGVRFTTYGNRTVRINMRTGGYGPGESVSFGTASASGESVNTAGEEADANDFASFVKETMSAYRSRETAWQNPGACAKLKFDPQSGALTLSPGDQGKFTAEVDTKASGDAASKASWTLGAQQNGSFSPTTSKDQRPSFSYQVSGSPSGDTMSVLVKATSTAGVAQDTWSQKLKPLKTVTGTFTGHATDLGVIYDWTGTATFQRTDLGAPGVGPGGVFQFTAGQATVTVSGSENGSGCQQKGTSTIGLVGQSPWTVNGTEPPFLYQVIVGFVATPPQAINFNCSDASRNGTKAGLGSMPVAALQSGDIAAGTAPNGLIQLTDDLYTYSGSASATGPDSGETESWTWSMKGST